MNMNEFFTGCLVFFPIQSIQQNSIANFHDANYNFTFSENQQQTEGKLSKLEDETFWQHFEHEIKILNDKIDKKIWTPKEDELLIELRENGLGWRDISRSILGTKDQICKRRYLRLQTEEGKWPKEIDNRIKYLYETENRGWKSIFRILKKEFSIEDKRKQEELKLRYLHHLKSDICKEPWDLSEDFKLMSFVRKNGRKWRQLSKVFGDRTELQLKNRYYGTLLPLENKIIEMLSMNKLECV